MKIAVYCSAKDIIPEHFLRLGDELGTWIARNGHALVYGGATGGLMTRVSDAAHQSGAHVIGIIPERIVKSGRMASNCDELVRVEDMCERKRRMRAEADCFVCLPGSYGTLDEMMDVIAGGTVGEHNKPIFILNYEGFYKGLQQEIEHMRSLQFLPQQENYRPCFVESLYDLYQQIEILTKK